LRGYKNTDDIPVQSGIWSEISYDGRSSGQVIDVIPAFNLLELLTKRIKSIELAREIWIEKYSLPILGSLKDKEKIATDFGYSVWELEKLNNRISFLKKEMSRIETSNLKAIENLMVKLHGADGVPKDLVPKGLYEGPLNHYLKGLKKRYTVEKSQVREMTDLQYYIWTLKNGKI